MEPLLTQPRLRLITTEHPVSPRERIRVSVGGAVQGVGFRPFVYRLAHEECLDGWVCNTPDGVELEVEGDPPALQAFLNRLRHEGPPASHIAECKVQPVVVAGAPQGSGFEIRVSHHAHSGNVVVQPDLATCPDCLAEIADPTARRFRYPFTNCTNCGPRYSIIDQVPYDRPLTTMRDFVMCDSCSAEYDDPLDRRFHAQPIACPYCGPQLQLWDEHGACVARRDEAVQSTAEALRRGEVVAIKGIGGFHLVVDARNDSAVERLRRRKHRPHKPFALLVSDLPAARALAYVNAQEEAALNSAAAPIVLLQARQGTGVAAAVAPDNPLLGIMVPSNPLQHLLMQELGFPVVATSGNLSDEPICTDETEARTRLRYLAHWLLVHNRRIARPLDDAVVRVINGQVVLLRIGRGYAPLHLPLPGAQPGVMAVGAHQKCTVAVSLKNAVVVSQHLGDIDNVLAVQQHADCLAKLPELYGVEPQESASDLHPDYASTTAAAAMHLPRLQCQHHHAHALACAVENRVPLPALAVTWDGTGYGPDGTVWGGEFLLVNNAGYERLAHFRTFALPGGDAASRDARRSCYGLLYECAGAEVAASYLKEAGYACETELHAWRQMIERGLQAPRTSSAGRLFDAVSCLLGLCARGSYEGQAAMMVEFAAAESDWQEQSGYSVSLQTDAAGPVQLDWAPMVQQILHDRGAGRPTPEIASAFHAALVRAIVDVAHYAGQPRVMLAGGCFQNARLLQGTVCALRQAGFAPAYHRRVPPNDNSIALGQVAAALEAQQQAHSEVTLCV